MEFENKLDFNTVYLEIIDVYKGIAGTPVEKELAKGKELLTIINETKTKTLIMRRRIAKLIKLLIC